MAERRKGEITPAGKQCAHCCMVACGLAKASAQSQPQNGFAASASVNRRPQTLDHHLDPGPALAQPT